MAQPCHFMRTYFYAMIILFLFTSNSEEEGSLWRVCLSPRAIITEVLARKGLGERLRFMSWHTQNWIVNKMESRTSPDKIARRFVCFNIVCQCYKQLRQWVRISRVPRPFLPAYRIGARFRDVTEWYQHQRHQLVPRPLCVLHVCSREEEISYRE